MKWNSIDIHNADANVPEIKQKVLAFIAETNQMYVVEYHGLAKRGLPYHIFIETWEHYEALAITHWIPLPDAPGENNAQD